MSKISSEMQLVCPNCKSNLSKNPFIIYGADEERTISCDNCKMKFPVYKGCIDFVINGNDKKN